MLFNESLLRGVGRSLKDPACRAANRAPVDLFHDRAGDRAVLHFDGSRRDEAADFLRRRQGNGFLLELRIVSKKQALFEAKWERLVLCPRPSTPFPRIRLREDLHR